ncbi:MAG: shikimate dehydrogenase, partial [Coprobacillus sp.]
YRKENEEFLEMKIGNTITGYTGLYGIVANPIKHSFSPMMHNTAFQTLGIDDVYLAFEVEDNQLDDYIKSVKTLNIKGFNVSMPYKLKIMEYLDEITEDAKLCQAVNTVKNENGKLIGHISDGKGFFMSCAQKGWDIKNQKVIVLGAGGAACAIIVEASMLGAKEIVVYNRSEKPFIEELNQKLDCPIVLKKLSDLESLKQDLNDSYLLIQTTNVGMAPHVDGCLIPNLSYLPQHLKVADIIYNPQETKLLQMAKEQGCEYMNGEGMILYQGAVSFHFWTGQNMPIEEVKIALGME